MRLLTTTLLGPSAERSGLGVETYNDTPPAHDDNVHYKRLQQQLLILQRAPCSSSLGRFGGA